MLGKIKYVVKINLTCFTFIPTGYLLMKKINFTHLDLISVGQHRVRMLFSSALLQLITTTSEFHSAWRWGKEIEGKQLSFNDVTPEIAPSTSKHTPLVKI